MAHADVRGRQCLLTAVAADTGERLWQRPLGLWPAADPLPLPGEGALVVDRCGRTCLVPPAAGPWQVQARGGEPELLPLEPAVQTMFPGQESEIRLLPGPNQDELYLYYTSMRGTAVHLRHLRAGEESWREIRFPAPLHGQPSIMGEFLVGACQDGFVYRRRLDGSPLAVANEQPFQWELPSLITPAPAHLVALGESAVLLADSGTRLRVLQRAEREGVQEWRLEAARELSAPMQGLPVVHGRRIYVADTKRHLHTVDAGLQAEVLVELSGRVTAGPVLRADYVIVVLDNKRLAAVSTQGEAAAVAWESEDGLVRGRMRGLPPLVDGVLVVSDDRRLLGLSVQNGRCLWEHTMLPRSFAVSAVAPIGERLVAQPLADGTLLVVKLPQEEAVAANPGAALGAADAPAGAVGAPAGAAGVPAGAVGAAVGAADVEAAHEGAMP